MILVTLSNNFASLLSSNWNITRNTDERCLLLPLRPIILLNCRAVQRLAHNSHSTSVSDLLAELIALRTGVTCFSQLNFEGIAAVAVGVACLSQSDCEPEWLVKCDGVSLLSSLDVTCCSTDGVEVVGCDSGCLFASHATTPGSCDIILASPDLVLMLSSLSSDFWSDIVWGSPDLVMTSPDLVLASPDLVLTLPDLVLTSPDFVLTSPDLLLRGGGSPLGGCGWISPLWGDDYCFTATSSCCGCGCSTVSRSHVDCTGVGGTLDMAY